MMTCISTRFLSRRIRVFALVIGGLLLLGSPRVTVGLQTGGQSEGRGTVKKVSIHGGKVTLLADGLDKPFSLAVDRTHVYFSEAGAGTIKKVPTHGGGRVITLAQGLHDPRDLAIDGTWLYFAERGGGMIKKVPITGGEVVTLARGFIGPMKIAVDADFVYFCEWAAQGAIKKVSKHTAHGQGMTMVEGLTFPFGTSVVNRELFFVEQTKSGTLNKMSIDGGPRVVLLSRLVVPELLAFDQMHVYFAEGGGGTIKKMPLGGGTATILAAGLMVPGGTVVDDKNVYFVETESGTVKKISKNGGPAVALVQGLHDPFMIAVDGDHLYFTEGFNAHRNDSKLPE